MLHEIGQIVNGMRPEIDSTSGHAADPVRLTARLWRWICR
jgi:hypothetical protein